MVHAPFLVGTGPTLACGLLDIVVLLLKSNMRTRLPMDLYRLALSAARRMAIFHKRNHFMCCHGDTHWHELWSAIFNLLGFMARKEKIKTNSAVLIVAEELIELFNLFITSGHKIFQEVREKGLGKEKKQHKKRESEDEEADEEPEEQDEKDIDVRDKGQTTSETEAMVVWNPGSALFYYKMVQETKTIQAFVDIGKIVPTQFLSDSLRYF